MTSDAHVQMPVDGVSHRFEPWLTIVTPGPLAHLLDPASVGSTVDLRSISIGPRGHSLVLLLDLSEFPAIPPARWLSRGYNRVEAELHAANVHELTCSFSRPVAGAVIKASRESGLTRLELSGDGIDLMCVTDYALLLNVRGVRR